MLARRGVAALRRPEYTGENRCLPCTALNILLVAAVGLAIGGWLAPAAGIAVVTVGLGLIYLRGYVVPGTPVLTQRFLLDSVLAYFEHGVTESTTPTSEEDSEFDPVHVDFRGEAVVTRVSGTTIAEWPSRAAFVADVVGAAALAEFDSGWTNRDFAERAQLLGGLRLWLDRLTSD